MDSTRLDLTSIWLISVEFCVPPGVQFFSACVNNGRSETEIETPVKHFRAVRSTQYRRYFRENPSDFHPQNCVWGAQANHLWPMAGNWIKVVVQSSCENRNEGTQCEEWSNIVLLFNTPTCLPPPFSGHAEKATKISQNENNNSASSQS